MPSRPPFRAVPFILLSLFAFGLVSVSASSAADALQVPAASAPASDPRQLFQRGEAALAKGDLDQAEAAFRAVLVADPQAAAAYSNLGVIAMRRKQWDSAIRNLKKAQQLAPKVPGIRLNIGIAEYRRANYLAAIPPLASVLRDEPDSLQARYLLGLCYMFVEKYSDALNTLEPLWPKLNNDFMYLYVLGISAFNSGNKTLDQKSLARLLEIGEDKPEFHLLLGKAFLNHYENAKALKEFESAAEVNPNLPFLHFNFGMVYQRMRKYDLAEAEYRRDIALEPDMAYNYQQLGEIFLSTGRDADAQKAFRDALQHEPRLPTSLLELAKIDLRNGKNQDALKSLDSAEKLAPDNQNIHYLRGQALLKLGRKQEARKELATAQKIMDASINKDRANMNATPVPNPELTQQP
jgi:tetratricopeptide (TPR) repeat protein